VGVGLSGGGPKWDRADAGGCRYYAGLMIYPDKFPNEEYLRILTEVTPASGSCDGARRAQAPPAQRIA
jgi:hypothetical protein